MGAAKDPMYRWKVLVVVMVGTTMSALDMSVVNVSLPDIMAAFGTNVDDIEWVVTGYMLGFSTLMPLTVWMRDRLGPKTLFVGSLAVFTLGSALCGLAWSLPALVAARVVQAFGGGAITPVGMAMIAEAFPPQERGKALGIWGVGVIAGPALGPPLGGFLTQTIGWRAVFNINVPIGIVGILLAWRILAPDTAAVRKKSRFDLGGFIFLSIFLTAGLLALSKGNAEGWTSTFILTAAGLAVFGLAGFLVVESVVPEGTGIVDLGLFRSKVFTASILVTVVRSVALFGGAFLLPVFLQIHMGYDEIRTGTLMLPGALIIGAMMPVAGRLADRIGSRVPVAVGTILTACYMFMYHDLNANTSLWGVLAPTLVRGLGIGLLVTPVTVAALNAVPTSKSAMASSMLSLIRQVAGSIGIASLSSILSHRTVFHLGAVGSAASAQTSAYLHSLHGLTQRALSMGYAPQEAGTAARVLLGKHFGAAASVRGFEDAFVVGGVIVLVGVVPALLLPHAFGRARAARLGPVKARA